MPAGNDLSPWADQGVLLLNTALTVEDGQPASHAKRGWETVTDALIALVARDPRQGFPAVGAHAQAKQALLPGNSGHLVLMSNHPRRCRPAARPCPSWAAAISRRPIAGWLTKGKTLLIGHWTKNNSQARRIRVMIAALHKTSSASTALI